MEGKEVSSQLTLRDDRGGARWAQCSPKGPEKWKEEEERRGEAERWLC